MRVETTEPAKPTDEWLTLREAAAEIGWTAAGLQFAAKAGEMPYRFEKKPRGRPAIVIQRAEFEAWKQRRADYDGLKRNPNQTPISPKGPRPKTGLPAELRNVIVPITIAWNLAQRSKQHLLAEVYRGHLRALPVRLEERLIWHFRLGDLSDWLESRRRYGPQQGPQFDADLLAGLQVLMQPTEAWNTEKLAQLREQVAREAQAAKQGP